MVGQACGGQLIHEGVVPIAEKEGKTANLSLCSQPCEDTMKDGHLQTRRQALPSFWICQRFHLGVLNLQNSEK